MISYAAFNVKKMRNGFMMHYRTDLDNSDSHWRKKRAG